MSMTSRQRMLTALNRQPPDRLPVTTHHMMEYFLHKYMGGMDYHQFFDHFGLDSYIWTAPLKGTADGVVWIDEHGFVTSDEWRITISEIPGQPHLTKRYTIHTPRGELSTLIQTDNFQSPWVIEHLIKEKHDIDLLGEYLPAPEYNLDAVRQSAEQIGERGLCRGHIGGFDQFHYFTGCTEAQTRAAVRSAFDAAGAGGGFILSPSDHFFDADPVLIAAFAAEARNCNYQVIHD